MTSLPQKRILDEMADKEKAVPKEAGFASFGTPSHALSNRNIPGMLRGFHSVWRGRDKSAFWQQIQFFFVSHSDFVEK